MRPRSSPRRAALTTLALCLATTAARADPPVDGEGEAATPHEVLGARSVDSGAFLPLGVPARGDAQRAYVHLQGGYDTGAGGPVFEGTAQARLYGPLSLRAGFGYVGPDGDGRPSVALTMDLLRQARHGVDLAVYAGYQGHGFNTVPAVALTLALGRSFGPVNLLANVGYGLGLEEGEHYGEARLAALVRVHRVLSIGLDARARLDLERDADEPDGEPDWDLVAGPLATLSIDRFVVGVGGGLAATKFRAGGDLRAGAIAQLSLGVAF
ncbi:MAG: hypothetical protein U0325_31225 [Polyangiales bacterium]